MAEDKTYWGSDDDITGVTLVDLSSAAATSSACLLCGQDWPHTHEPEELIIYRNGIKRGVFLATHNPAENDRLRAAGAALAATVLRVTNYPHATDRAAVDALDEWAAVAEDERAGSETSRGER